MARRCGLISSFVRPLLGRGSQAMLEEVIQHGDAEVERIQRLRRYL